MGHLINPIGLRVGWSSSWCDSWYTEFRYYPEFLHEIFFLRLYLEYLATSSSFERGGILFSHCQLKLQSNFLFVRVFFYDGLLFASFDSMVQSFFNCLKALSVDEENRNKNFQYSLFKKYNGTVFLLLFSFFFRMFAYSIRGLRQKPDYIRRLKSNFPSIFKKYKQKKQKDDKKKKTKKISFPKALLKIKHPPVERRGKKFIYQDKNLSGFINAINFDKTLDFNRLFGLLQSQSLVKKIGSDISFEIKYISIYFLLFKSFLEMGYRFYGSFNYDLFKGDFFYFFYFYFFSFFALNYYRRFFLLLSSFLKCILNILSPSFCLKIELLYIDNYAVSAKMVSRFICRRLAQGYSFKEVINPLLRELKNVSTSTRMKLSSFGKILKKDISFREEGLKLLLTDFFFVFKNGLIRFFKLKSTWFNFTLFSFFFWIGNRRFTKFSIQSFLLIGFSKIFFKRLHSFFVFFDYSSFLRNKDFFVSFKNFFLSFFSDFDLSILFFKAFDYLFSNSGIILDFEKSLLTNFNDLFVCNLHYNRLLRFNYWNNVMQHVLELNGINNRKIRQQVYRPYYGSSIIGYKMHCCGRFSRKQIASSLWFNYGRVPLNTLSARIDYGFNTIPLHNSLISIKVWIYKDRFSSTWFFKQI